MWEGWNTFDDWLGTSPQDDFFLGGDFDSIRFDSIYIPLFLSIWKFSDGNLAGVIGSVCFGVACLYLIPVQSRNIYMYISSIALRDGVFLFFLFSSHVLLRV
jgi:hypothetical protein